MYVSKAIPWKMFDRIIMSFAILGENGNLTNERATDHAKILHIISSYKKARPDGQILISNYGEYDDNYVNASKNSQNFAEIVLLYLKKYEIDGFDLDWESVRINDLSNELINLLKTCKYIFKNKYKLSHAIWPGVHSPKTVGMLANLVDEINIMSYEMSISSLEFLINQYNQSGFPYEKMVLGMETETRNENNETICGKIDLVNKYNLRGIFVWRLDNDDIPIKSGIQVGPPSFRTVKMLYGALTRYGWI